jgi:tripartite ATP-independent transporter DctP family solute receptor
MYYKRIAFVFIAVSVFSLFSGCKGRFKTPSDSENSTQRSLVLKLSHVFSKDTPMDKAACMAAENIKARTNGAIEIQVSTNGTLPHAKDGIEQCVRGADFISLYDPSVMADWVPDYLALMGPFLVETREEFRELCESKLVEELNKKAEEQGIKVLALPFNFGFRNIASGKLKIMSPEDLKGLKFRVPSAELFIKTFSALGASTITTPSSEVYNAIQTGLADANETSISDMTQMQMQEVLKYISLTRHFIGTSSAVMSKKVFDGLTPEQQQIIIEEFKKAAEVCSADYEEKEAEAEKIMKDAGITILEVDRTPFIEKSKVIYSQKTFPNLSPDIYERLQAELVAIRAKK